MSAPEIDRLIELLAKLPGLGPRSARRVALHLIKRPAQLMTPLADAMSSAARAISTCRICGNVDTTDPCRICAHPERDASVICVVEDVADLWAIERTGVFRGRYHVLGGTLSALDGVNPEDLNRPPPITSWSVWRRPGLKSRGWPMGCRSAASSTISTTAP
jgi:recombination protein RecR